MKITSFINGLQKTRLRPESLVPRTPIARAVLLALLVSVSGCSTAPTEPPVQDDEALEALLEFLLEFELEEEDWIDPAEVDDSEE